jgi:alkylation response protein AidB-like acyl-CoA dehydrogenase
MTHDDHDNRALRREVRALVADWVAADRFRPRCDAWLRGYDAEFSQALADRGWIGLTWPVEVGGGGRSNTARLVLTEELLRAGAPVARHWMGDRQIGPAILRYGTPELQHRYLPRIAAGEVTFCLGMSESEAGSDLSAVRTAATAVEGGWRITGRKIWTSHAHRSTHAYVLARTDRAAEQHAGLSEFIVDMTADGVQVRPILDLRGDHHFNEVVLDDVFVPDDHVLGQIGNGWKQVTEQLAFERGGMERVLSTYPLLAAAIAAAGDQAAAGDAAGLGGVGRALALLATLRRLARHVAGQLDAGEAPVLAAAILKDVGTRFEQDVSELARDVLTVEPDPAGDPAGESAEDAAQLLADGILAAPGFTIRGGVTAVLRSIIARSARPGQLPELPDRMDAAGDDVRAVADDVLHGRGGEPQTVDAGLWPTLLELGWAGVGRQEDLGGAGGELADLVTLVQACGRHVVSVPLLESAAAGLIAAQHGHTVNAAPATVAVPRAGETLRITDDAIVTGYVSRVPWGRAAATIIVVATRADGRPVIAEVDGAADGLERTPGTNLAGEPRDGLRFADVTARPIGDIEAPGDVRAVPALLRSAMTLGALENVLEHTAAHVAVREQFGRPLARFQDVASTLAQMIEQVTLARVAVLAATEAGLGRPDRAMIAAVVTARAATDVARSAHQLHGAMGVTREHPLHLATRRLWSWRDEWGSEREWAVAIAAQARPLAGDPLWDWLTGESE